MKRFFKSGEPFIWLTGGGLAVSLIMVLGLVLLILVNGLGFFWPRAVVRLTLADGAAVLGEVADHETAPLPAGVPQLRSEIKRGNRDIYGNDFVWIEAASIVRRELPPDAAVIERREWGNLYGVVRAVREGEMTRAEGSDQAWAEFQARLPEAARVARAIRRIEKSEIGAISYAEDRLRRRMKRLARAGVRDSPEVGRIVEQLAFLEEKFAKEQTRLRALRESLTSTVVVSVEGGADKELPLADVIRAYRPNRMGLFSKAGLYAAKLWEFVSGDPRESNTEGGVFPAIFGTVMMVLIMSVLVTPLGVLAALYLREYARPGPFVSAVRIAVNNLAGVPSIVFGVFGVGFFIYGVGGAIDRAFFPESLPTPTFGTGGILWASLTLALMTVPVVIVATEEGLAAIPRGMRDASLALGATKFETTWRVVLPSVLPSMLTGLILAMARAAGEVAPLMITGVVKLAPALPVDGYWPFFHLDRKFMHLGFHIYDVGFQSPNVEAARPMVYATTLLLLVIVVVLNLGAIALRNRLRRRFATAAV